MNDVINYIIIYINKKFNKNIVINPDFSKDKTEISSSYCTKQNESLSIMYPEFLKEWNYEKNIISPNEVHSGSALKVWWKCKNSHEWEAKVKDRTNNYTYKKGTGCPYCCNQKVSEENSLLHYYPNIKKIFIDTKYKLEENCLKSNKRIKIKCENGHEDERIVRDITKSNKCRTCKVKLL
jgi:hypothetical protein